MSNDPKVILALIAGLVRERDNARGLHRDALIQPSESLNENKHYAQEIERHARAMRRARLAITSQAERRAFDEIYRKNMEAK